MVLSTIRRPSTASAAAGRYSQGSSWGQATASECEGKLVAELSGEPFDQRRHRLRQEVKAVTYHQLAVEPVLGGWRARVVFDI